MPIRMFRARAEPAPAVGLPLVPTAADFAAFAQGVIEYLGATGVDIGDDDVTVQFDPATAVDVPFGSWLLVASGERRVMTDAQFSAGFEAVNSAGLPLQSGVVVLTSGPFVDRSSGRLTI